MNKSMLIFKTSRKYHKWLMAFVGIQFAIWSLTGAYMVYLNIDYIHGDTLVNNAQDKIDATQIEYPLSRLLQRYPEAKSISINPYMDKVVYRFELGNRKLVIDSKNGDELGPLNQSQAELAARYHYSGNGGIKSAKLISENAPFELNPRLMPVWQVNFTDFSSPSIYISAETGKLVGKRHDYWRLFDWMFRFHVMDYDEGGVDNTLLFWFTLCGILSAIFGIILIYYRVFRNSIASLIDTSEKKNNGKGANR